MEEKKFFINSKGERLPFSEIIKKKIISVTILTRYNFLRKVKITIPVINLEYFYKFKCDYNYVKILFTENNHIEELQRYSEQKYLFFPNGKLKSHHVLIFFLEDLENIDWI